MVILVDTNIIIDALANREPYADDAKRLWKNVRQGKSQEYLRHIAYQTCFIFLEKISVRKKEDFF